MTMRAATILATVLLALAVGACGGGGGSTSTSTATTAGGGGATTTTAPKPAAGKEASKQSKGSNQSKGSESSGQGKGEAARKRVVHAAPLKVSGGGSAQFKVKGGDNSVQEYGEEAEASELREVAELVHSFYVARIAEEWGRACSYLAAPEVQSLERLAAQAPQLKGKGCAGVLDALTKPIPASFQRAITAIDAASLRHEGEQGFLIYTGPPHETVYSMPLRLEAGQWKVSALSASALPGT